MFEIGKIYNRRNDIHAKFKGQQYGGIATPADYPRIQIISATVMDWRRGEASC